MSKVQTLEKIISYKKEYPKATASEISEACGISKRYLRKCKKEIEELSFHLRKPLLARSEVDLLLSKLDTRIVGEREIYNKLTGTYIGEKDRLIRMAEDDDLPKKEYLKIGLWRKKEERALIDFWLSYLLYDTLFFLSEGEIDYRLASLCEEIDGYKKWRVLIKKNLHWSDGKPIKCKDVIETIKETRLADFILEIKKAGEREIIFTLFSSDPLFSYKLSSFPILPSHSSSRYSVTSGPFRLKKTKDKKTFSLERWDSYYGKNQPHLEYLLLKTFSRSTNAVKAVIRKELDFLPLRSLHQAISVEKTASPQSFPFNEKSYYLLLINKKRGPFTDESNIKKLKNQIDYNLINLYLEETLPEEISPSLSQKGELDIKIGYLSDLSSTFLPSLALLIASSLSLSPLDIVNLKDASNTHVLVDVIVTQLYFGYGYSRLRQFFHSEGKNNAFGINLPFVDYLIEKLDKTASMRERRTIGQEIISLLQKENAIILLAPCFEYFLSNLYLVPSPKIRSLTSFILNLSNICVERKKTSGIPKS